MSEQVINNDKMDPVATDALLANPSSSVNTDVLNINDNRTENALLPSKTVLKRNLGLFSGVSFIMGVIIGKRLK